VFKEFSDPLYGFVRVEAKELNLIDSLIFQRLRHIQHSRFEHALGVLHLADSIFTATVDNPDPLKRTLVRLAALIHDLGHPPFSHTTEVLLPERRTHEDLTRRIVFESEIYGILKKSFNLSTEDMEVLLRIALNTPVDEDERFLSEIITGQFGADRMDYLRRDAFFCGVSYGLFDLNRLLSTLNGSVHGEKRIAVHISGLRALEDFLLSRYFMYLQVYFHKVVRILSIHLVDLVKKMRLDETLSDLRTFLTMNDCSVLSRAFSDPSCREDVERIFSRKHFKEVFSTKSRDLYEEVRKELMSRFPPEVLRFDEAYKPPYDEEILLFDGRDLLKAQEVSELIGSLKPIEIYRVYAEPGLRKEICSLLRRLA